MICRVVRWLASSGLDGWGVPLGIAGSAKPAAAPAALIDLAGAFLFRRRAAAAARSNRRGAPSMDPLKTDNRTEYASLK
ncbi:hypothetical protein D3C76_1569780 [compost metagenome]